LPLTPPPRDDSGAVIPHDHEEILPNDGIIRGVSTQHIVHDPKAIGGKRVSSSMLFNPSSGNNGGVSVDLQRLIEENGFDAKLYLRTRFVGLVRFEAYQLRDEGFKVGYDPIEKNPYHGEVWGSFSTAKKKKLFQLCTWFVPLKDTQIQ
jgi:hypothetical protein